MESAFLSEVELYYSSLPIVDENFLLLDEECHHIKHVMRHKEGDTIYVTDGKGYIYNSTIVKIGKNDIECKLESRHKYGNKYTNICFCIPRLKNADRFEFALEKCVELGITNFIVFESKRTVAKGEKIERWEKILLAAMKQSLRAWLPKIYFVKNVTEIMKMDGEKILLDQNAEEVFNSVYANRILNSQVSTLKYFVFGPEGGFSNDELLIMSDECRVKSWELQKVKLSGNRLRSETAVITAASILTI